MVVVVVVVVIAGKRGRRGREDAPGLGPGWTGSWTGLSGCRPVDRVLCWAVRSVARLTGLETGFRGMKVSLSCSSRKPSQIDQIEGKRWNWRLKVGEIVDQAQQHQIHGPKPLKTQPNHRSVKRQFGAIFGDFVENFLETKSGGWRVKIAVTKSC